MDEQSHQQTHGPDRILLAEQQVRVALADGDRQTPPKRRHLFDQIKSEMVQLESVFATLLLFHNDTPFWGGVATHPWVIRD